MRDSSKLSLEDMFDMYRGSINFDAYAHHDYDDRGNDINIVMDAVFGHYSRVRYKCCHSVYSGSKACMQENKIRSSPFFVYQSEDPMYYFSVSTGTLRENEYLKEFTITKREALFFLTRNHGIIIPQGTDVLDERIVPFRFEETKIKVRENFDSADYKCNICDIRIYDPKGRAFWGYIAKLKEESSLVKMRCPVCYLVDIRSFALHLYPDEASMYGHPINQSMRVDMQNDKPRLSAFVIYPVHREWVEKGSLSFSVSFRPDDFDLLIKARETRDIKESQLP